MMSNEQIIIFKESLTFLWILLKVAHFFMDFMGFIAHKFIEILIFLSRF